MASSYTPLGVELMVTGENAGTWGTKTNTNLQLFEQISGGFKVQTLNAGGAGANTTALAVSEKFLYFPVPTISLDLIDLPATLKISFFKLSSTYKVHYF